MPCINCIDCICQNRCSGIPVGSGEHEVTEVTPAQADKAMDKVVLELVEERPTQRVTRYFAGSQPAISKLYQYCISEPTIVMYEIK